MDSIDKQILIELEGNCRLTYQTIADKIGLSRSAVKRRVDKLQELGVIEEFVVEFYQNACGLEWLAIDVVTDASEDVDAFIKKLNSFPVVFMTGWLASGKYLIYGQADNQYQSYEIGKEIRIMEFVKDVILHPMIPITNRILSTRSMFQGIGSKMELNNGQLRVLKALLPDARKPISKIVEETNLSSKRVKTILDSLLEHKGIHFTIMFNLSAHGNTNCILKLLFDEKKSEPNDVVRWIQKHHSHEYWNSFLYVHEPVLMNFFTCSNLKNVSSITRSMEQAPFTISAEPLVVFPSRMNKGLRRLRLEEMLSDTKL